LSDVVVTLSGFTVCVVGVLGELATLAANAGVVSMVAASRTAAIFLFIVILPSGHWLIETGPNDHATACMPPDVKED
jgi:hypothetical protein